MFNSNYLQETTSPRYIDRTIPVALTEKIVGVLGHADWVIVCRVPEGLETLVVSPLKPAHQIAALGNAVTDISKML